MAQIDRDSATTTPPSPPPQLAEAVAQAEAAQVAAEQAVVDAQSIRDSLEPETFAQVAVANVFSQPQTVPDEGYDEATWTNNLTVPTKNAVRDLIEPIKGDVGILFTPVGDQFTNLRIEHSSLFSSPVISANSVALRNSSQDLKVVQNVSLTLNLAGDVGGPLGPSSTPALNTWYYRWLWWNSLNGLTATFDTSATTPTPPTGYSTSDYKLLLPGASRTNDAGGVSLVPINTFQRYHQYFSMIVGTPVIASGAQGNASTPTFVSASLANVFPPNARIGTYLVRYTNCIVAIAESSSQGLVYRAITGTTTTENKLVRARISNNQLAYAASGSASVLGFAWED